MKKTWVVGVILSFLSVAVGFSAPLSDEALAAILDQPTGAACPQPEESLLRPDQHKGVFRVCNATATCNDTSGVSVSCSVTSSGGSCTFQNQNCAAGIRGQVNCNGTIKQCPACCGTPNCCICEETGDCFACCKCGGGTFSQCSQLCGPPS